MPPPPSCCLCQQPCSSKMPILACHGQCGLSFHFACVQIPIDVKEILKTVPGLEWKCEPCRKNSNYLKNMFSKCVLDVTEQLTGKISLIEKAFDEKFEQCMKQVSEKLEDVNYRNIPSTSKNEDERSYARVTSAASQSRLLIKPKNKDQDIRVTKSAVLGKVDPVKMDVKVRGVKPARDGGIILGCDSVADSRKMLSIAQSELSEQYEIREMNGILPSVRLVGLSERFDPESVSHYLRAQNVNLFTEDSVCNVVKVEPLKNKNTIYFALLKVDTALYQKLLDKGHVLIGLDSCSVYDAFTLTRCYCCNDYNHISTRCPKKDNPTCGKCSAMHNTKDCNVSADKYSCSNCINFNDKHKTTFSINHAVWEYANCESYARNVARTKKQLLLLKTDQ